MQNQTIFELYTDDNKSKYSSNPKDMTPQVLLLEQESYLSYIKGDKKGIIYHI